MNRGRFERKDGGAVGRRLTSDCGEARVDVERVPVSTQAVQRRLEPTAEETGIV